MAAENEKLYEAVPVIREWLEENLQHVSWSVDADFSLKCIEVRLKTRVGGLAYQVGRTFAPEVAVDDDGNVTPPFDGVIKQMAEGLGRAMFIVGEAKETSYSLYDLKGRKID